VLDPRIPDGLTDIRRWTLDDICIAHSFLDECDGAEARAESRARDAARMKGQT
jgi:hypothetical protein